MHYYWEFSQVSDEELQEWQKALRLKLAEPQRKLRMVNREIKRRQAKQPSLDWLLYCEQSNTNKTADAADIDGKEIGLATGF